jgi:hypothetical protein
VALSLRSAAWVAPGGRKDGSGPVAPLPVGKRNVFDHLWALPSRTNRTRVAADWLLDTVAPRQIVQLGFLPPDESSIDVAEQTGVYR